MILIINQGIKLYNNMKNKTISKRALNMLDKSAKNLKQGKASKPINLKKFKDKKNETTSHN